MSIPTTDRNEPTLMNSPAKLSENPPTLRYLDQTPLSRPENKRLCSELSPVTEMDVDIAEKIQVTIQESIQKSLPSIIETLERKLQESIMKSIETALVAIKKDVHEALQGEMEHSKLQTELQIWCESEKIENYNRRDNIRIFGIPEDITKVEGRTVGESAEVTMNKVLTVAKELAVNVQLNDLSIAHRLPTRVENGTRPIIARFARRIGKINMLRQKKALNDSESFSGVKIYEDITLPRLRFLNLLRDDPRVESAWTREGVINFKYKGQIGINKIESLYEGGIRMNYSLKQVRNCFATPVRN